MDFQFKGTSRYEAIIAESILIWIRDVTGESFSTSGDEENFCSTLKDGILLCRLVKVLDNTIRSIKINKASSNFASIINIENFLAAAACLGVRRIQLFQPLDLVEQNNLHAVLTCLRALQRQTSAAANGQSQNTPVALPGLIPKTSNASGNDQIFKSDSSVESLGVPQDEDAFSEMASIPERCTSFAENPDSISPEESETPQQTNSTISDDNPETQEETIFPEITEQLEQERSSPLDISPGNSGPSPDRVPAYLRNASPQQHNLVAEMKKKLKSLSLREADRPERPTRVLRPRIESTPAEFQDPPIKVAPIPPARRKVLPIIPQKSEDFDFEFAEILYHKEMEKLLSKPQYADPHLFQKHHEHALKQALECFGNARPLTKTQVDLVKSALEEVFKKFSAINDSKQKHGSPIIGIDLGTTNCCVAVVRKLEKAEIVPNALGKLTTPSYVRLAANNFDVGETAKSMAFAHPESTIFDMKRMIGRLFNDENLKLYKTFWPFEVQELTGDLRVKIVDELYSPESIYTKLILYLKKCAEQFLNQPVVNAVITIPAHFNSRREYLTKKACYDAGLNVVKIISEPTAAALAYNDNRLVTDSPHHSLIFDLGGGTFDVAVIEATKDYINVLAIDGDRNLGGQDFDNALMEYCIQEFHKQYGIDLRQGPGAAKCLRRIKDCCEKTKEYFAGTTYSTVIAIDAIHIQVKPSGTTNYDLLVRIDRDLFYSLIDSHLNQCMQIVEAVLKQANVEEIKDVVMVGGSSKIPRVQEVLKERFGEWSLCNHVNPDEAVAQGAAIFGNLINKSNNIQIQELERYLM